VTTGVCSGKNLATHTRVAYPTVSSVPSVPTAIPTIANGHSCPAQVK